MRCFVVARRLIKQISGDKRTLGLILMAPVFIMFILSVVLTSNVTKATIEVINKGSADLKTLEENAKITVVSSEDAALADIKDRKCDAYLIIGDNGDKLVIEGTDPAITGLVKGTYAKFAAKRGSKAIEDKLSGISDLFAKLPVKVKEQLKLPDLTSIQPKEADITYVFGGNFKFFDTIAPGIMGFIIFFLVFLLSGVSFLRERISGTLERMMASSIRRWEIVLGYLLGFGLFVVLQTVIIQSFLLFVLNINTVGNFWVILLINLMTAAGSLALGTLLSSFARNEFQLFQFIPVIIIPQILFSGLFDIREAPQWVNWLSKVFPLTYSAQALRDVMVRGKGLGDVWVQLVVLAGFMALFMLLNILSLRKYRKA